MGNKQSIKSTAKISPEPVNYDDYKVYINLAFIFKLLHSNNYYLKFKILKGFNFLSVNTIQHSFDNDYKPRTDDVNLQYLIKGLNNIKGELLYINLYDIYNSLLKGVKMLNKLQKTYPKHYMILDKNIIDYINDLNVLVTLTDEQKKNIITNYKVDVDTINPDSNLIGGKRRKRRKRTRT